MSARFRIIHFMPDPFTGARVPVAALVEGEDRRVQVTRAPHIPGPQCLGGRAAWSVIALALESLEATTAFNELPSTMGPHFLLDEERRIPDAVFNPAEWVATRVLPKRPLTSEDASEKVPHSPKRQTQGMRFFETNKVDKYVEKNFDGTGFEVNTHAAHHISHYVIGKNDLLLMEPVIGNRSDLRAELRDISQAFLAWRAIFANRKVGRQPSFIAYVLGGTQKGALSTAREVLEESRAEVVSVDIPNERDRFVERIRHVGRSVESGNLPFN
jgi:hypothetical protein